MATRMTLSLYFHTVTHAGGAERVICWLSSQLASRGHQIHLITLDPEDAESYYPLGKSITWHRIGLRAGLLDKLRRFFRLAKILRQSRTKTLVGFVMSGDKSVYAAAKISGVNLVAAERNAPSMYDLRYSAIQRILMLNLLRLADKIVVQFDRYRWGYPKGLHDRIIPIGNPVKRVPEVSYSAEAEGARRNVLLAVGRLDRVQKGLHVLIEAFSKSALEFKNWDLRIVGAGPALDDLNSAIKLNKLADRITIVAPHERIFEEYDGAQLFVMPSRWEGFPNALAEAMSHGLPAIGFEDAMGVSDLLKQEYSASSDEVPGWLAPGNQNVDRLADTLALAMGNVDDRVRKSRLAIERIETYDESAIADQWQSFLRSLEASDHD